MTEKSNLGGWGENKACEYLVDKGFKIIERNFRKPWGEIDIVAFSPDRILVFVEVKTVRKNETGLSGEDQMTVAKIKKFKKIAQFYAAKNPKLIKDEKGFRLDLLTLTLQSSSGLTLSNKSNGLTKDEKDFSINHYQNIF